MHECKLTVGFGSSLSTLKQSSRNDDMTPDLGLVKRLLMKLSGASVSSSLNSNQNTFRIRIIKDCNFFTLNNSEMSLEIRFCHFVCPREKYHCIIQNHKGFKEDIKRWFCIHVYQRGGTNRMNGDTR